MKVKRFLLGLHPLLGSVTVVSLITVVTSKIKKKLPAKENLVFYCVSVVPDFLFFTSSNAFRDTLRIYVSFSLREKYII